MLKTNVKSDKYINSNLLIGAIWMFIIETLKNKLFNRGNFEDSLSDFSEFFNIGDAKLWGQRYYGKMPEEKTYSEIEQYCGYLFNPINAILRQEDLSWYGKDVEERYINRIILIKVWLYSFNVPENIIVYRAISKKRLDKMIMWSKEKFGNNKNVLYEAGFLSTSLVFSELKKMYPDRIYLKIFLLKGTNGAYVDLISKRPEEQEFLIPPGAKLFILRKKNGMYSCILDQRS